MSYMQMKRVLPNGDVLDGKEFRPAQGWSPSVWGPLTKKYRGLKDSAWMMEDDSRELWILVEDPRLDPAERIVLAATFDNAWVCGRDVLELAGALRTFALRNMDEDNQIHHLSRVATVLEESWVDGEGVAFYGTSVNSDPWQVCIMCPTCGESEISQRPRNVFTDPGAHMLHVVALSGCLQRSKFVEQGEVKP